MKKTMFELNEKALDIVSLTRKTNTENLYFADGVLNQIINIIKKELYENSNN